MTKGENGAYFGHLDRRYTELETTAEREAYFRASLYERDQGICGICGFGIPLYGLNLDHVIPKARGGETRWSNLRVAHSDCNSIRGDCEDEVVIRRRLARAGVPFRTRGDAMHESEARFRRVMTGLVLVLVVTVLAMWWLWPKPQPALPDHVIVQVTNGDQVLSTAVVPLNGR